MSTSPDTLLEVPSGRFELHRPGTPHPSLRAWDAADLYALHWLFEQDPMDDGQSHVSVGGARLATPGSWIVVNDRCGALSVPLAAAMVGTQSDAPKALVNWSDSFVSHSAAKLNLGRNEISPEIVRCVPSTEAPDGPPYTVAVIKVPKALATLHHQLTVLKPLLHPNATVLGAGMTRDVHTSSVKAFENLIGPTVTSKAWRKARLLHGTVDPAQGKAPPALRRFTDERLGFAVTAFPSVFSANRLDDATALLLDAVPWDRYQAAEHVIDLGCGTGVLGTFAAKALPQATVSFCDESYMATASAEATFTEVMGGDARGRFLTQHVLEGIAPGSVDLILCNPPFHGQRGQDRETGRAMVREAARVLRPGGVLYMVGNRHLEYHKLIRNVFGRSKVVASDRRFVVLAGSRDG